jgi:hypothetical protein
LFKCISATALLALAVGCASTKTKQTEKMLSAAGFKIVAASTASQQQKLQTLPPGKVTVAKRSGKTYYVFPDATHNQIYVGNQEQYQAYQQILSDNKISAQERVSVEMNEDAPVGWDGWDEQGWGD